MYIQTSGSHCFPFCVVLWWIPKEHWFSIAVGWKAVTRSRGVVIWRTWPRKVMGQGLIEKWKGRTWIFAKKEGKLSDLKQRVMLKRNTVSERQTNWSHELRLFISVEVQKCAVCFYSVSMGLAIFIRSHYCPSVQNSGEGLFTESKFFRYLISFLREQDWFPIKQLVDF